MITQNFAIPTVYSNLVQFRDESDKLFNSQILLLSPLLLQLLLQACVLGKHLQDAFL